MPLNAKEVCSQAPQSYIFLESGIKLSWYTEICLPEDCLYSCSRATKDFCCPICFFPLSTWWPTGLGERGPLGSNRKRLHLHWESAKSTATVTSSLTQILWTASCSSFVTSAVHPGAQEIASSCKPPDTIFTVSCQGLLQRFLHIALASQTEDRV